ncbi:MAG TPA: OmpA family protein, partial [bacterium]|nr:OmpA family protein [bacterium]
TGDITASLGLFEWVDLGLAVPVVLFQNGDGWNGGEKLPPATLGDIRFAPRARIYRTEDRFFSIAVVPVLAFPTGQFLHELSGAAGFTFSPTLALSIRSKWVCGGLNFLYRMTQYDHVIGATHIADQFGIKAQVTGYAIPETLSFSGEWSFASTASKTFGEKDESPMEAALAASWHAPHDLTLTVGGGAGIMSGFATPLFRVFAGLTWILEQEKETTPPEKPAVEETPAAEKKPATAPSPVPVTEKKPEPAPQQVTPKKPMVVELGAKPEPKKPEEKKPVPPPQVEQKKTAPAVAPVPARPTPIPPLPVKKMEPRRGTQMTEVVFFQDNSTTFTDESRVKLEKINLLLSSNYTLKIRIEGHADRNEKPEMGLKRAQAIKLWLIDRDIESSRIQTMGIGADEPAASSDIEADRARNRRVTFWVLDK